MAQTSKGPSLKPLVLALAVALAGFIFMQNYLSKQRRMIETSVEKIAVMVSKAELKAGDTLSTDDLDFRMVAADDQPWSSIKFDDPTVSTDSKSRYESMKAILDGQKVLRDVNRDDILLWTDIEESREEKLSGLFEGRLRGVAVMVDQASMMGGLLSPNDSVDVLATFPAGMNIQGGVAETHDKTLVILENVNVLAVNGRTAGNVGTSRGSSSVVLALNPEQALLLSHVQKAATISLLLRPMESSKAGSFGTENRENREVSSPDIQNIIEKITTISPRS
jgi:Flp pilus assembly protein CpaB